MTSKNGALGIRNMLQILSYSFHSLDIAEKRRKILTAGDKPHLSVEQAALKHPLMSGKMGSASSRVYHGYS